MLITVRPWRPLGVAYLRDALTFRPVILWIKVSVGIASPGLLCMLVTLCINRLPIVHKGITAKVTANGTRREQRTANRDCFFFLLEVSSSQVRKGGKHISLCRAKPLAATRIVWSDTNKNSSRVVMERFSFHFTFRSPLHL